MFGLDVDVERARCERVDAAAQPEHRVGVGVGCRLERTRREDFDVRVEGARVETADEPADNRIGVRMTARW